MEDILNKLDINATELSQLISLKKDAKADFLLVDIREDFEVADGYIEGCDLFAPTSNFNDFFPKLEENKEKNIVLYCRSGGRSAQARSFLKEQGFAKVSHLAGGIMSYTGSIIK